MNQETECSSLDRYLMFCPILLNLNSTNLLELRASLGNNTLRLKRGVYYTPDCNAQIQLHYLTSTTPLMINETKVVLWSN